MLIDTHAHLNFPEFDKDRESVIERAFKSGIEKIINIGTNLESSRKSIELAEKYKNIYATVSCHPIEVDKEEFNEDIFLRLAAHQKVVAIGETGLDYYHQSNKETQKKIFEKLVKIAIKVDKPLIIHRRNADQDIIPLLMEMALPRRGGVIHCFGRDFEIAKIFLDLGFLISYTGNVTYNPERISSIEKIPLKKIMAETDCPFMTPVPFRGRRNEPQYLKYIAEKIAKIKNLSYGEIVETTTKNARELFQI